MDLKAVERAINLIEEFRKIDATISATEAVVLLLVAKKPGITQTEIEALTGASRSGVSRYIEVLGDGKATRKITGHRLVTMIRKEDDQRYWGIHLTPKGERVIRSIIQYTGG